jgi:hypothetical protein
MSTAVRLCRDNLALAVLCYALRRQPSGARDKD